MQHVPDMIIDIPRGKPISLLRAAHRRRVSILRQNMNKGMAASNRDEGFNARTIYMLSCLDLTFRGLHDKASVQDRRRASFKTIRVPDLLFLLMSWPSVAVLLHIHASRLQVHQR